MHDDTTPATKADISGFRNELKADIREFRNEFKADMLQLRQESTAQLKTFKDEILRHFDLAVETIRHDLVGADRDEMAQMKDRSQDHEQRILRLERSSSLAAPCQALLRSERTKAGRPHVSRPRGAFSMRSGRLFQDKAEARRLR
jgi:hypothetical protein